MVKVGRAKLPQITQKGGFGVKIKGVNDTVL